MDGDPMDPIDDDRFIEGDDDWTLPDELFPDRVTGGGESILRTGAVAGDCGVRGVESCRGGITCMFLPCCPFGTERDCGAW